MKNVTDNNILEKCNKLIQQINKSNKNKLTNDYFVSLFFSYIKTLFETNDKLFFSKEKDFQKRLKEKIKEWLLILEEYNDVILERQLIGQRRIDLSLNISSSYIGIELKNGITGSSIRTLEYQINEYIEKGLIYNYFFVIIKLRQQELKNKCNKINNIYSLIKRLIKNNKIILLIV